MTAYEFLYEYLCLSCGIYNRYEFKPADGINFRKWEHDLRCSECDRILRDNPLGRPLGVGGGSEEAVSRQLKAVADG